MAWQKAVEVKPRGEKVFGTLTLKNGPRHQGLSSPWWNRYRLGGQKKKHGCGGGIHSKNQNRKKVGEKKGNSNKLGKTCSGDHGGIKPVVRKERFKRRLLKG